MKQFQKGVVFVVLYTHETYEIVCRRAVTVQVVDENGNNGFFRVSDLLKMQTANELAIL